MEVKRVVVVGCGSIGKRHARLLAAREDVAVELLDLDRLQVDKTIEVVGSVPVHGSYADALASAPDAVLLATPVPDHAQQCIDALVAGVHVFCEKPLCDTLANARRIAAAATASDRVFNVGFVLHFHPAMRRIKEVIQSGNIGRILHVHWHIGTYLTLMLSVSRHQASLEGALLLDYAHQPDMIYWWLQKRPTSVFAAGCQGGGQPLQSNPNVMALILEYEEALLATINLNYVQHPNTSRCEITGDEGWLYMDLDAGELTTGMRQGETVEHESFVVDRDSPYINELDAFLSAVDDGGGPESPIDDAMVSMEIIEAAMASWRRGERVVLGA
jgi:UDP-N-acetylglucosamine 3-dehydrogenase